MHAKFIEYEICAVGFWEPTKIPLPLHTHPPQVRGLSLCVPSIVTWMGIWSSDNYTQESLQVPLWRWYTKCCLHITIRIVSLWEGLQKEKGMPQYMPWYHQLLSLGVFLRDKIYKVLRGLNVNPNTYVQCRYRFIFEKKGGGERIIF